MSWKSCSGFRRLSWRTSTPAIPRCSQSGRASRAGLCGGVRPVGRRELAGRSPSSSPRVMKARGCPRASPTCSNQNYPGTLEIIVVSDGSTDGTAAALGAVRGRRALHRAAAPAASRSRSTPASPPPPAASSCSRTPASALRPTQSCTGLATSTIPTSAASPASWSSIASSDDPADSTIGDGVGLYWTYEKWLRRHESRSSAPRSAPPARSTRCVASSGAPLPAGHAARRRAGADARGAARLPHRLRRARPRFDRTSPDASAEARRKIRTLAGNYQILAHEPRLLIPFVNPVWLQYVSHKVGRLLVPWALVGAFFAVRPLPRRLVLYGCVRPPARFLRPCRSWRVIQSRDGSRHPQVGGAKFRSRQGG